MAEPGGRLFTPRFFLMCGFTFTVFLSLFQLLPTAPYRILQLGGSEVAAGLFLGGLTYASALSAPVTGALSDRVGRRRMLVVSSVVITGFAFAYAFSPSYPVLIALVFVHGLFWSGLMSASAAYMIGMIPPERRAEGISYWGMATVLATAAAPALGLFVFRHGWLALCASVGVLNILMAVIAWNLPEDGSGQHAGARPPLFTKDLVEWRILFVSMSLFLVCFAYGSITSFVALYTEKRGIAPRSLFFTVFSLVVFCVRPVLGRVADAVGARLLLLPCLGLVAVALAMLAIATTRGMLIASAVVFGLGFGNLYPVYVTHVLKYVSPGRRGAAFGGILAAFDTGIGTGSILAGVLIRRFGFQTAYATAAAIAALSIPVFVLLERRFLVDESRSEA
jgi:MFS family permease